MKLLKPVLRVFLNMHQYAKHLPCDCVYEPFSITYMYDHDLALTEEASLIERCHSNGDDYCSGTSDSGPSVIGTCTSMPSICHVIVFMNILDCISGVPEAYKIMQPFLKDIADHC